MNKKNVRDIELAGKRVIMRVDFNVPLDGDTITDDTRIRAALPTIEYILDQGAGLVLMSHLGRPKGKRVPEMSLAPAAAHLQELLQRDVAIAGDCIGEAVAAQAAAVQPGQVLMLENTRFHAAEEGKGPDLQEPQREMARQLAALGDIYVNDAFGAAHRAHASTAVIAEFAEAAVAGFLIEKELEFLGKALESPERPFVAIIGGAKVSGKLELLKALVGKVDTAVVGGGMAYTFFKAQGRKIGNSLHEDDLLDTVNEIIADAVTNGVDVLLPVDNVIADDFSETANTQVVSGDIPDGWEGMDIGPATIEKFSTIIAAAKTIVWNGPLGCFEMAPFAKGTMAVCQAIGAADAVSIVGGGDSVAAVQQSGLADRFDHVSTGGGALLEFLEGKILPGIAALNSK
ncbi:MAG: phosphoglycerate kinase [Lentisphaeria bacterium]|jgi:phosphoglycerate kinase|nr:phosphoglycerate kinase [Lentisphaeria bacterium]